MRPDSNGSDFYLMSEEGYLIVDAFDSDGNTRWELIRLDTGEATEFSRRSPDANGTQSCSFFVVIPSPDGQLIALLDSIPSAPGCTRAQIEIEFLDSSTLTTVASYSADTSGMPGWGWTRAGDLHVWGEDGGTWRVDVSSGPASAPVPDCTWPRTSSSPMNSAGVAITGGTLEDPIVPVGRHVENCW